MIEMQWVKLITHSTDYAAQNHRYEHAANVGGFACVLQYRDVIEHNADGSAKTATYWQDVAIGQSMEEGGRDEPNHRPQKNTECF